MSLYPHYVAPVAAFSHNTCRYPLKIEEVTFSKAKYLQMYRYIKTNYSTFKL